MERLNPVIAELEAARNFAVARFAAEANMPVVDFLLHFRVIMNSTTGEGDISFTVEPIQ